MKKVISFLIFIILYHGTVAQSDSNYLPVRLSSFEVGVANNIAKLHWSTICYLQYANFEIQKSIDGKNFTTINTFTADKLRCLQPFNYIDSSLSNLGKVFYRINVGSIDGNFSTSAIRSVYLKEEAFNLLSVYPTIASTSLNFSLANNTDETIWAVIVNGSGKIVGKQQYKGFKGITRYQITTDNLPGGFYFLQVANGKGNSQSIKFIRQ
jgi:hypothetical protein